MIPEHPLTLRSAVLVPLLGAALACAPAEPPAPAARADGPVELIPRSVLFGNPERELPRLSPDGRRYAFLAPVDGVLNIWVSEVGEGAEPRPVTRRRKRPLYRYFWSPDGEHVFYLSDNDGDENWGLYATHVDSGEQRAISTQEDVQVQILAVSPNHPDRILIAMNRRDPLAHDVYSLDIRSGATTLVAENPGNVRFWIIDTRLAVLGRQLARPDAGFDLEVRDGAGGEWRHLLSWQREDAITSRAIGFSADGGSIYLLDSRGAATGRLVALDLASGELEVLAEDPDYDLGDVFGVGLLRHPRTREPQAVAYQRQRRAWKVLDPELAEDFAALARIHLGDVSITSRSHDDTTWFVRYEQDTAATAYVVYDRASRTGTPLFENLPELSRYPLAPMEPIRFTARDGLEIEGYVTFPVGVPKNGLPMVVLPHGGPWYRDSWGFNADAQWLANRGYVALNVNFRGSTRYGKAFVNAADKEWGRKMLWDLVDGTRWAVEQGWVDAERVGIFGGSFGGYQSLCAAAFAPDTFAAAVDLVGPSNLVSFMRSFPPQWETRKYRFWLRGGDPRSEVELLEERSPYHHADRIEVPLLIAHGANDPRVKQAESDQIVERLRERGIPHRYLVFEDEGHGFARPENLETFSAAVEAFFAEHLGGRQQTGG